MLFLMFIFKALINPLFQLAIEYYEIKKKRCFGWRVLGRRGLCYPHGYDLRQLGNTFLVTLFCVSVVAMSDIENEMLPTHGVLSLLFEKRNLLLGYLLGLGHQTKALTEFHSCVIL